MIHNNLFNRVMILILLLALFASGSGSVLAALASSTAQTDPVADRNPTTMVLSPLKQTTNTHTIFLPLVTKYRPPTAKLGIDFSLAITNSDILEYDLPLAQQMGATWARLWLSWAEVEATPGQYNWELYDALFARFKQVGLKPLPVVHHVPDWAGENGCGPITDTPAFETFMDMVIARYGSDVEAWEFMNEPDGRMPHPLGPSIGCWGLYPDKYAAQLAIFYNKVKTLDPEALVLFGGLAYDNWVHFERDFFENTLKNGAGPFFDVISLHYYPINLVEFPTLAHKVNEIHEIMARNNVAQKRVWITETAMWVNGSEGLEGQLDFIVEDLTRGFCAGVDNSFWFAVREEPTEPPLHRWLISKDHQPDNGYYTFQHLAQKLEGASCLGGYQNVPPDIEAYQFEATGRLLYILWSNTFAKTVTIPASTNATLIDRDGNTLEVLPVQNGQVTFEVGTKAVFLEIVE